jgi:D-glycero-alpha-D-manno-heptose-7-phosphate kinase
MMVISRTPFRVSLAGGGSDFREYYRHGGGAVVSMAIDRYMYVTVNRRFDDSLRVSYTRTEIVDRLDDLHHDIIREALRRTGVTRGVEVTTIADLPAGIGLGSSSTLTVGVLNALYAMQGVWKSPAELARQACEIEIDVLAHPIGKQDQYIAAFGGLQHVRFHADETVSVQPVVCPQATRDRLVRSLLLFFTGVVRNAGSVLTEAKRRMASEAATRTAIDGIVAHAEAVQQSLASGRLRTVGEILHASWELKKQMASNVSNPSLDALYSAARQNGAIGGKVAGAGGGGCLLLFAPPARQAGLRRMLVERGLKQVPFTLEPEGSRIVHYGR